MIRSPAKPSEPARPSIRAKLPLRTRPHGGRDALGISIALHALFVIGALATLEAAGRGWTEPAAGTPITVSAETLFEALAEEEEATEADEGPTLDPVPEILEPELPPEPRADAAFADHQPLEEAPTRAPLPLSYFAARPFTQPVPVGCLRPIPPPAAPQAIASAAPAISKPPAARKHRPQPRPPTSLSAAQPIAPRWTYPSAARRRGLEGTVVVEVLVGVDGRPGEGRIIQASPHSVLNRAALRAVMSWTFRPAQRDGQAIPSRHRQPLTYSLR